MFTVKIKSTALFAAIMFASFLVSCAGTIQKKEPKWVNDPYQVYGSNQYVAAVGYGPGRDAAEKNALSSLTAIFGQSISSESQTTYTYTQALQKSGAGWSENSDIAQAVKTSVDMNSLIGAEIKDVWDSGTGTFYAVAAMDKARTSLIYSEMVQQNLNMISRLTSLSAADKQSFDGYARYQQAASYADANAVLVNVMKVIRPAALFGEDLRKGDDYRLEAQEIARNIPVVVEVENDRQGRIGSAFSKVLSGAGFRTGGANSRYVLRSTFSLEDVSFAGNPYQWKRYTVDAKLTDTATGQIMFPYSVSSREGHNSLSEAENRAIRAAETEIQNSYVKALSDFLAQGSVR